MRPWILTTLAFIVLTVGFASPARAARNRETFTRLSGQILETLQSFYPVEATRMGIHSYDHRLADYSPKAVKQMRDRLTGFVKQLHAYRDFKFTQQDGIDYKLIRSNVEVALLDLDKLRWYEKSPQLYVDEAVDGVYYLMLSQHAPLGERLLSILARMKEVPDLFATAKRNVKAPPEVYIELATESLAAAQKFYQEVATELTREFPARADEIQGISSRAREAMNDFAVHLGGMERGPEAGFAVGKDNFDYLLSHYYFLNFDSDSLLRLGENLLAEIDSEYRRYQAYVEGNYQNGKDSVFVPASFNRQDVLDYYQWETGQVRLFLEQKGVVTVPADIAPVRVVETPPVLRSMITAVAYQPAGPFDEHQEGIFYVRPLPNELDSAQLGARYRFAHRRGFKGSVVHEAYPGHHLQMQVAGRHPSDVRKWQSNPMLTEGWALYCEELMYRAGLYGGEEPSIWLAVLGGLRYRAARIVADVKLHTGRFTYDECVDWMIKTLEAETESDRNYHRSMVRKYTCTPTRWMCYLVGKKEIERLRDDVKVKEGDQFSERKFYDRLLAEGSIPLALIRETFGLK